MGILTKGMGVIMKRFSKPKKVTKSTVDLSDDGGPYVRKQKFNAKKAHTQYGLLYYSLESCCYHFFFGANSTSKSSCSCSFFFFRALALDAFSSTLISSK